METMTIEEFEARHPEFKVVDRNWWVRQVSRGVAEQNESAIPHVLPDGWHVAWFTRQGEEA